MGTKSLPTKKWFVATPVPNGHEVTGCEVERCFHSTMFLRRSESSSESNSSVVKSWLCHGLAVTLWESQYLWKFRLRHLWNRRSFARLEQDNWLGRFQLCVWRGLHLTDGDWMWYASPICSFSLGFVYSVLDKILLCEKKIGFAS